MLHILKECPDCAKIIEVPMTEAETKTVCPECGSFMVLVNADILQDNFNKKTDGIIKKYKRRMFLLFIALLVCMLGVVLIKTVT